MACLSTSGPELRSVQVSCKSWKYHSRSLGKSPKRSTAKSGTSTEIDWDLQNLEAIQECGFLVEDFKMDVCVESGGLTGSWCRKGRPRWKDCKLAQRFPTREWPPFDNRRHATLFTLPEYGISTCNYDMLNTRSCKTTSAFKRPSLKPALQCKVIRGGREMQRETIASHCLQGSDHQRHEGCRWLYGLT